jgi:hypothetical protein
MTSRPSLRLRLGQIGVAAFAVLAVTLLAANLPARFAELSTVCAGEACGDEQLRPADVAALQRFGLAPRSYAVYTLGLYLGLTVACWSVSAVLIWRRADDAVALLAAMALIGQGATGALGVASLSPGWNAVMTLVLLGWYVALVNLLYVFPDGRFVPAWTRWSFAPWLGWLVLGFGWVIVTRQDVPAWYWAGLVVLTLSIFALGGAAQIFRYRRVSTLAQRQQTKWVVAGFAALVATEVLWAGYTELVRPALGQPPPAGVVFEAANTLLDVVSQLVVPLSIGAAIFRYRLWDIDVVVERTLVYSTLTGLLTLAYFGSVVAFQTAAALVTERGTARTAGQPSAAFATVASTLVIAALFSPLRGVVQGFIDRRFFRRRYDAARTLAGFGANLRDEVELDRLHQALIAVVEETMQPEHVSIWIRNPAA